MEKEPNTHPFRFRSLFSLQPMLDYLDRQRSDTCCANTWHKSEINNILERAPELAKPIENLSLLERYRDEVETLIHLAFPPAFFENEIIGAVVSGKLKLPAEWYGTQSCLNQTCQYRLTLPTLS